MCGFGQDSGYRGRNRSAGNTEWSLRATAFCERLLGNLRRECLDHFLILSEQHLYRVVKEHQWYVDRARPHRGIGQRIQSQSVVGSGPQMNGELASRPVLGGSHHDYRQRAAESRRTIISPSSLTDGSIQPAQEKDWQAHGTLSRKDYQSGMFSGSGGRGAGRSCARVGSSGGPDL